MNAQTASLSATEAQLDQADQQVGDNLLLMPTVTYDGIYANPGFDVFSIRAARRSLAGASNELVRARSQIDEWEDNRKNWQAQLDQLKAGEADALTVRALVSHFQHYGGQVLVCAPPQPVESVTGADPAK